MEPGTAVEARPRFSVRTLDDGSSTLVHLEVELPGEEAKGRHRCACRRSRLRSPRRASIQRPRPPGPPSHMSSWCTHCRRDRQQPDSLQRGGRPPAAGARAGALPRGERCAALVCAAQAAGRPSKANCGLLPDGRLHRRQQLRLTSSAAAPACPLHVCLNPVPLHCAAVLPARRTSAWACRWRAARTRCSS